jgi:hypothetical protein
MDEEKNDTALQLDSVQMKITKQAQEMLSCVYKFKELLVQIIPQYLNIDGNTYAISDLSEVEQNYYNTFVQENFNKTIIEYDDSVKTIIKNLQSHEIKIKNDEIYNSYYFFKWKKKSLVYKLEMIDYTIDVDIYQEPLRYEYFDRNDEEWYPTNRQEKILKDLSSCVNNPQFENISIMARTMAWYGLIECLVPLHTQASIGYDIGYSMIYGNP